MHIDQPEKKMDLQAPKCAWIGAKHFGATNKLNGIITGVRTEKGKFGTDFIVKIQPIGYVEELEMTVWGSNYNYLYNTFGPKSEMWLNREICITQTVDDDRKVRRVISA
jgi:hypothetical protein